MADFRIMDEYPPGIANNCCYLCRASIRKIGNRKERVIDTMIHIYGEGFLAICESCMLEAASLLGMLSAEKSAQVNAKLKSAQEEALQLKTKISIMEDALNALTRYNETVAASDK